MIYIFDVSETDEQKSMKLNTKPDLNVFYQMCVVRADWLRYFRHLLWIEFNETLPWLQEVRSKNSMSCSEFVFLIGLKNNDDRNVIWLDMTQMSLTDLYSASTIQFFARTF